MNPSEVLNSHRAAIHQIVQSNHARNARVFGPVLHGDDADDSDLDFLIDATPDTSFLAIARIQNRLQKIPGITIDVLTPKALPERFRDHALAEAKPVWRKINCAFWTISATFVGLSNA